MSHSISLRYSNYADILDAYGVYSKYSNLGVVDYSDPIITLIFRFFSYLLHPVIFNNLFLIFSIIVSFLITTALFRILLDKKNLLVIIFSIIFTFSLHLIFRVMSLTPAMYLIFFIPLVIVLLLKNFKPVFLGILVFITLSFTNYYGFFCFILVCFWFLFDLISKKINIKQFVSKIIFFIPPVNAPCAI